MESQPAKALFNVVPTSISHRAQQFKYKQKEHTPKKIKLDRTRLGHIRLLNIILKELTEAITTTSHKLEKSN